jgi:hypothetical protein
MSWQVKGWLWLAAALVAITPGRRHFRRGTGPGRAHDGGTAAVHERDGHASAGNGDSS